MDFGKLTALMRPLRGASAAILLALSLSDEPLTNRQLQIVTGYSDKPITVSLRMLEALGYVVHAGHLQGWTVSHDVFVPGRPLSVSDVRKDSEQSPYVVVVDSIDHMVREEKQQKQPAVVRKSSEQGMRLLREMGVNGGALRRIDGLGVSVACVVGWAWYVLAADWMSNRAGYVVRRLLDGDSPSGEWMRLAEWWLEIGSSEREYWIDTVLGCVDGAWVAVPCRTAADLRLASGEDVEEGLANTMVKAVRAAGREGVGVLMEVVGDG